MKLIYVAIGALIALIVLTVVPDNPLGTITLTPKSFLVLLILVSVIAIFYVTFRPTKKPATKNGKKIEMLEKKLAKLKGK